MFCISVDEVTASFIYKAYIFEVLSIVYNCKYIGVGEGVGRRRSGSREERMTFECSVCTDYCYLNILYYLMHR